MQNLQALQRNINSAQNLHSIVTTMKAFASSNINQFQNAAQSSLAYRQVLDMALYVVLSAEEPNPQPRQKLDGKTVHLVFGSDHGLAGRFNEKITSFALTEIPQGPQHIVLAVGQQIQSRMGDLEIAKTFPTPQTEVGIAALVQTLLFAIEQLQEETRLEQIILYYNKPAAGASFTEEREVLFPIDLEQLAKNITRWDSNSLPTYFSKREDLLSDLIQQYIFITLYRTLAYSLASENASRLASMQAAQKNIEERLAELSSSYRRQRQNNITEEITDINSGFRAIKKIKGQRR